MSSVFENGALNAAQALIEELGLEATFKASLLDLLALAFMNGSLYGTKPTQAHRDTAARYLATLKERGERPCRAQ